MESYIGTKIIKATRMDKEIFNARKNKAEVDHGSTPGYLVVYPDGYQSWSPKDVFEAAYREVSQKEKDLINDMGFNESSPAE